MVAIIDGIQSVLSIMIMIGVGYVLTHKGWLNDQMAKMFSNIVVKVALPALMIGNLTKNFSKEMFMKSWVGILIALGVMIISYLLGAVVVRACNIPNHQRGLFQVMFAQSNTIFMGLPINLALFGDQSIPMVMLFYLVNTMLFWTFGVNLIRRDGGHMSSGHIFSIHNLKRVVSPPLIAFIISMVLIFLDIQLPKFLADSAKYIGGITTPLSMFFIGIIIYDIHIKDLKLTKNNIILIIGRFILCPLLTFGVLYFSDVDLMMKKVYVIEAAMPVMTQAAIISKTYDADYKYATILVSMTTLGSLIFIPIYTILVNIF